MGALVWNPYEGIMSEVRDLGIRVGGPKAIGPVGLDVLEGQEVHITEVTFNYRGPATRILVGVGWKLSTSFESGARLVASPFRGWGFSPPFNVDESVNFLPYQFVVNRGSWVLLAPVLGANTERNGTQVIIEDGKNIDSWQWALDLAIVDLFSPFVAESSAGFLALDTDTRVINMPLAPVIPAAELGSIEVRYTL